MCIISGFDIQGVFLILDDTFGEVKSKLLSLFNKSSGCQANWWQNVAAVLNVDEYGPITRTLQ